MARPLRIQFPGAVYHVMNRGGSRQRVFFDKQDHDGFLKTIGEVHAGRERPPASLNLEPPAGPNVHICFTSGEIPII
jgi:hypothetical protein